MRARLRMPRSALRGNSLGTAMQRLNLAIAADTTLATARCDSFGIEALQLAQRQLFSLRSPELQHVYENDRRSLRHPSLEALASAQVAQRLLVETLPKLWPMIRDGLCHEIVMIYAHHVAASTRSALATEGLVLPLLPESGMHSAPKNSTDMSTTAYQTYVDQVSCVTCHVSSADETLEVSERLV